MIITASVYDKVNRSVSGNPPEIGGIIGSSDNNIINEVVVDFPTFPVEMHCSYTPNVDFLNKCIEIWSKNGICFKGIFHTHFMGIKSLSIADKRYIKVIMSSMTKEIEYLYFPIFILPNREFSVYVARKHFNDIQILPDEVIIK